MIKMILSFLLTFAVLLQLAGSEHWSSKLFSKTLVDRNGNQRNTVEALKGKKVAVYFSASWCGPCRAFTPQLVKFYNETALQKGIEIVFCSSDKNAMAMKGYMQKASMPWLAVPFDGPARAQLKRKFNVRGIPRLIVFDEKGTVLSFDARWDVMLLGAKAVDAWSKKNYRPLTYFDYKKQRMKNAPRFASQGSLVIDSSKWVKGPSPQWHIRLDTAFRAAAQQNKKLFVLTTGSNWCGWCKKLYREVLSSEPFRKFASDNLILVYLDFPRGNKQPESQRLYNNVMVKALRIYKGAPAAFILDQNGQSAGRLRGYQKLDRYMSQLKAEFEKSPKEYRKGLPLWVKHSPERLKNELLRYKMQQIEIAENRMATTQIIRKNIKFNIAAWGLDEHNVNTPFTSTSEIKANVGQKVYFKVQYQLPPGVSCAYMFWLAGRRQKKSSNLVALQGTGECIVWIRSGRVFEAKKFGHLVSHNRKGRKPSFQFASSIKNNVCSVQWLDR